ncbi:MAG TPA: hypothetical protein DEO85_10790 [Maritimibacter sp.]|nr:hypothetical protein [Maritimibacter sp.]
MVPPARLFAALIALVALAAIGSQLVVTFGATGSLPATLWIVGGFFTVLTNVLVLVTFARAAGTGTMPSPFWIAGLTLWILIVGAVYHVLLSSLWSPAGLQWWADQGLHSATPLLTLAFWLVFAPKAPLPWRNAALWLWWPLLYVSYALIRGLFTGVYPYPFIDLNVLTYGQLVVNAVGLSVAFYLGGLVLIAIARGRHRV